MAVGVVIGGAGLTQDQYYQVFNEVTDHGDAVPSGMISHRAGASDQGYVIIEVWDSREDLEQFFHDKLGKVLAEANVNFQPMMFEIENSLQSNVPAGT